MLFDVTFTDLKTSKEIDAQVGPSFSFIDRLRLGGVGSERTLVKEASEIFTSHLPYEVLDQHCNLELRPMGLLAYFHFKVRDLVWVVPYRKSSLYQNEHGLKIYCDTDFIRLQSIYRGSTIQRFIRKMMLQRATYLDSLSLPR